MKNIICGFPGIGKSFLSNKIGCHDSDSSKFDKRDFPQNYMRHIKKLNGLVLVSTHLVVRDALFENGLEFSLCYPHYMLKYEYMDRYAERGSNSDFLVLMCKMWDRWMVEMENENRAINHYVLQSGQFISDLECLTPRAVDSTNAHAKMSV